MADSTLSHFMTILQEIFTAEPPVYTKPATSTTSTSPTDPKLARLNTLKSALAQKLREKEHQTKLQLTAEIERLLVVNRELVEGEGQLSHLLSKLADEQQRISTNSAILEEKNKEIEGVVEELKGMGEVNPDDVVLGRGVGGVQVFEVVADEYAIDDAVYCLSNALSREVIGLQVFMKHVRTLARDQFMRRALIKKIRAQGGLGVAG
ncbi:hypothetical protein HDV00_003642 [Rhizophlyctis rosea]|nr:hypothetical protein HDV00_003642 [Rhizophlyctis rosea]